MAMSDSEEPRQHSAGPDGEERPEAIAPGREVSPASDSPTKRLPSQELQALIARIKEKPIREERVSLDPVTKEDVADRQSDRALREKYAIWIFKILVIQLVIMNYVFVCVGIGWLKYEKRGTLELYLGGTLAEVFGIVLVVTRNLFPTKNDDKD